MHNTPGRGGSPFRRDTVPIGEGLRQNGNKPHDLIRTPVLNRFLRRPAAAFPAPAPDTPLFVIGDVHGCADHLRVLLDRAPADAAIVCVGDLVDRGPDSAAVLRMLRDRDDVACLMGNHETMMLDFLRDPLGRGRHWLRHGGVETLASFGLRGSLRSEDAPDLRDRLRDALGPATEDWLAQLPPMIRSGNVALVHAGADPARPLEEQRRSDLIWGHAEFGRRARDDGQWVVRGHIVVDEPEVRQGVISIDTGAYATGRLTALHLDGPVARFLTVTTDDLP